ncbi:MAG: phage antirepressor KilAC domain-containing protein [Armatimonadia bacterium]
MSDIHPTNDELVFIGPDGSPITTSLVISEQTGNEHASVIKLIRENADDLNEVGALRFEIAKGKALPQGGFAKATEFAVLDEPASALLMTYLRNTAVIKDFKKRLVAGFYAMRQMLTERALQAPLTGNELMAAGFVEAVKQLEQRDARIYQLETRVNADAPKVTYVDTYVTDADLLSFSTVASSNNVAEKWLRELLISRDWIYRQSDTRWSEREQKKVTRNRYSEKSDKKRYFRRVEEHKAPRFRGSEVMHTLKITPQGAEAIARLVAKEQAA